MINHWTMVDRGGGLYYSTNTMWIRWMYSVLIIFHMIASTKMDLSKPNDIHCPSLTVNSACPCYKFDDGLFLECPGITTISLRTTLKLITSPIQSLSIYDFDRSVTSLSMDLFQSDVNIRHLQISHSHLQTIPDTSLKHLHPTLESLSIVNGKLTRIPIGALKGMQKLMVLDFESNNITEIPDYSFFGLRLIKLNIKGNQLEKVNDNAFTGLEETMLEIDLSDNKLQIFPMNALKRLDYLRSLRLSLNSIKSLHYDYDDGISRLRSLIFLDLSSNQFSEITNYCFRPFLLLKTLSLYNNRIETIHKDAFTSLKELQSLDLSHNKIIYLNPTQFSENKKLKTIDLSHNHLHYISGVFRNLPELTECFLSYNNILELPSNAFTNSTKIHVIYLEMNSIKFISADVFHTLINLDQLYLSMNFIVHLPRSLFDKTNLLTTLKLDSNRINELDRGIFQNLNELIELRLHNNQIKSIRNGVFQPLPSLIELHLQNNHIDKIEPESFVTLKHLQHINLQNNNIKQLGDIFPHGNDKINSSLLSIQLDANKIDLLERTSFSRLMSVQIMWLGHNQLIKLEKSLFIDLHHIERIYLVNNSISIIQMDTFDNMKVLKVLDLSINKLRTIKQNYFIKLLTLEELNLSMNQINEIETDAFKNLRKLRILDLSNNLLIRLYPALFGDDLRSVTLLNIKNNTVNHIESDTFNHMNNLNELIMEHNHLTSVDIKHLDVPSLRKLRLSFNNFTRIESMMFERLPSIQMIEMVQCHIVDIPEELFRKNTNLVKIDLSKNQLDHIKRNLFTGLNVLKELRINNNRLSEFPHIAFTNISTLESLILHSNTLTNVDFFKLNGLPNLRHLDLRDNMIQSVSGFNAVNLTQLDYVDLSGNILAALPANFLQHSYTLQRIDLSSNRFQQIPISALSEKSLPRLAWLNLTGNPLERIYAISNERYPFLREIFISQTNLTIITSKDFDAFPALQHLHLLHNRINRISPGAFVTLQNLLTLDLSINELELLPRERLQGLKMLQLLNISNNNLRELEEFSIDLNGLQTLDLSNNLLERINRNTLKHLVGLNELYLTGNKIKTMQSDAFKHFYHLRLLDIRKNKFEMLPLKTLKLLETHMRTLRIEENPLNCNCETQEIWEWLRDHQKWSIDDNDYLLECEQPANIKGRIFTQMEPQQFCDTPLIIQIGIQDIQRYSVVVTWQAREHSGLHGYQIVYQDLEGVGGEARWNTLDRLANSAKITDLMPDSRYRICVLGLGNWLSSPSMTSPTTFGTEPDDVSSDEQQPNNWNLGYGNDLTDSEDFNDNEAIINNRINGNDDENHFSNLYYQHAPNVPEALKKLLSDPLIARCAETQTLDASPQMIMDENGLTGHGLLQEFLTRRLGLIVGCCLGIIVFVVLISVLGYLKIKKRRVDNTKRQQQMPPDYTSYRQYSIPNDELNRVTMHTETYHPLQSPHPHPHPKCISGNVVGMTTINGQC